MDNNTKQQELREKISKEMGWWKHETDDYYGHDGQRNKTDKVYQVINSEVKSVLEELENNQEGLYSRAGSNADVIDAVPIEAIQSIKEKYNV